MEIHAYCTEELLIHLSESSTIDLIETDTFHEQIAKVKLFDLLRNGVKIHYAVKNANEANPFIKSLMKKGSSTALNEQDSLCLKENPAEFIATKSCNNSLFLLADNQSSNLIQLEAKHGYHCINHQNYGSIFKESVQLFERNSAINDWSIGTEYLQPHNSLLIVDPYLFTRNGFQPFVDFLENIIPTTLDGKYHLSIIANKNAGIDTEQAKAKLHNFLLNKIKDFYWEVHLFDSVPYGVDRYDFLHPTPKDFHDRYIISNNVIIFSGRGLDYIRNNQENYEGTWLIYKPFSKISLEKESAFFTKVIEKKIKGFKRWIKQSDNTISNNPLITCYTE